MTRRFRPDPIRVPADVRTRIYGELDATQHWRGDRIRAPPAPASDESEVPSADAFGAVRTRACQSSALGRAVVMRSIDRRRTLAMGGRVI